MKQKIYHFHLLRIVERFLNKLIQKEKTYWNLNLPNQEKHFLSDHKYQIKDPGRFG